ncbi:MAG: hypothetical protein IJ348_07840 [Alistipes sp.]|nr:hypothetical protein [Alistipes sp.]MBQ7857004.1 hypothetical protein [Alistipes sp.]
MWEYIDILIIGGVVIIFASRVVTFLRRVAARLNAATSRGEGDNTTEAEMMPQADAEVIITARPVAEWLDMPSPTPPTTLSSTPTTTFSQTSTAAPELTYELEVAMEAQARRRAKQKSIDNPPLAKKERRKPKELKGQERGIATEMEEDFDLRKAIIYSEIMRPKYIDDEI